MSDETATSGTPKHRLAREQGFRGARLVLAEGISAGDAAQRLKTNRGLVSNTLLLLAHGTPEEIAAVETHRQSLRGTLNVIYQRVPVEQRRRFTRPKKFGQEARQQRDQDIAVWNSVNVALKALTSLPKPHDVSRIMRKHYARIESVNKKLLPALAWLTEFSDAWTK